MLGTTRANSRPESGPACMSVPYSADRRMNPKMEWGGAGVVCTGGDYLKVLAAMLNGGVGPNGARILKQETVDLMYAISAGPEWS